MLVMAGIIGFLIGAGGVHAYHRYGTPIRAYVHDKTKPPAS